MKRNSVTSILAVTLVWLSSIMCSCEKNPEASGSPVHYSAGFRAHYVQIGGVKYELHLGEYEANGDHAHKQYGPIIVDDARGNRLGLGVGTRPEWWISFKTPMGEFIRINIPEHSFLYYNVLHERLEILSVDWQNDLGLEEFDLRAAAEFLQEKGGNIGEEIHNYGNAREHIDD